MFQQGANRIGADVPGMARWIRRLSPIIPLAAGPFPVAFFIGVLAGEEPIDHTQKQVLRNSDTLPPVLSRIMEIHVAEEARQQICRWFYDCPREMHAGIAEMYVADPRFTKSYEDIAPGLAQYVRDAVVANAARA